MTVEKLEELKVKYNDKYNYFKGISFDKLAADFKEMAEIIEQYIQLTQISQKNTD